MSLTTLIQNGLSALLDSPVIETLTQCTGKKAVSILQAHLTFSAFEIAETYQKSHNYAIAAIAVGLATPDEKRTFIKKLQHAKVKREFADQIDEHYLRSFAVQRGIQSDALPALRQQLIENLNKLTELPPLFVGEQRPLTESELAAAIDHKGTLAITDLVLAQLRRVTTLDDTLEAFLRHQDLLGNAVLHFFVEQLRKEPRAETTFAALQREGLWADVRYLKAAQQTLTVPLEQQLAALKTAAVQAIEPGDFVESPQFTPQLQQLQTTLAEIPRRLQAAQAAWQTSQQPLIEFAQRFNSWADLLDDKVEQVLAAMATLHGTVIRIDDNVKQLLAEFRQFKQRLELSNQIKASDEFTHHTSTSLKLIQAAIAKLKQLPSREHPDYNQLLMMAGTVLFSTGNPDNIAEAEQLLTQARDCAQNVGDKALACFNLFQVRLRRKACQEALADLQTAIRLDAPQYALHDVGKYPIKRILGAGGMGCVFLCQDVDALSETSVVVKCFWEGRKGSRQQVFKEAIIMRDIGGAYIPKPLHWGFVDVARQTRPFFVTEYIEGALDGEQWLVEQGKLDVPTGIAVGLQVAKGLQVAHKKHVYHLDLKPANLLFKRTETGLMVKIIDFGLARVATSLKQEVLSHRSASLTQFGQAIAGTLLYAPPEQLGETQYGRPGAKSDLFSFAATLYRLMTGESPHNLNPRSLTDAPPELFDLLCHCKEENPAERPDSAQQVVKRLEDIQESRQRERADIIAKHQAEEVQKRQTEQLAQQQPEAEQKRQADIAKQKAEAKGQLFEFDVVTVNANGKITNTKRHSSHYQTEDLGNGITLEMVYIPGGTFLMGSPETEKERYSREGPQHRVTVQPFFMGKYSVTQAQWQAVMSNNPSYFKGEKRPVEQVSYDDVVVFCQRLSEMTGKDYRLPSEVQWEYTCRAGTTTPFYFGETITTDLANYNGESTYASEPTGVYRKQTTDVGQFPPNAFGLYDMHSNVWEWCADPWHGSYEGAPTDGSVWEAGEKEDHFVLRGGSWVGGTRGVRTANRVRGRRTERLGNDGVRLVRIP